MDLWSVFHLTLGDRHFHNILSIYCHSPGGGTAAALADMEFYMICAHLADMTMQRPWQSLRSLSVLVIIIMPPLRRGGGAGALSGHQRPSSVRLSDVAYIGSNSKTKRPRKRKLCTGVPQVTCDSHTDFKVRRSKVKVTGWGHIVAAT